MTKTMVITFEWSRDYDYVKEMLDRWSMNDDISDFSVQEVLREELLPQCNTGDVI